MTASLVAIRFLHFWATAVLVGGGGLAWLLEAQRPPAGTSLLRRATGAAGVTGLAWLVATLANVTGATDAVFHSQDWIDFLSSPFGPPWAILVGLALLACSSAGRIGPRLSFGLGTALTVDQAWLGHAAGGFGIAGAAAITAYVAHVLAGFAWVGALTMLWACRRETETLRAGLAIVSSLGLFVVALIVASGCINAAGHIGSVADLTATAYGRVLLAKIALVVAMLGLAAVNRREAQAKEARGAETPGRLRSLKIRVGAETLIGLLVLAIAAVLGITEPPA